MGRSIAFVSGKGGVGKTTITSAVGALLAYSGKRVCLVDADFRLNNLDIVLGIENKILFDIADVLSGNVRVSQALVNHSLCNNLYLLAAKNGNAGGNAETFKELIAYLCNNFDYVLIDSPAGVGRGFNRAVGSASEIIVVTTPHISAIRDADKVLGLLKTCSANVLGIVVNMARGDYIAEKRMLGSKDISAILNTPVIGMIEMMDCMLNLSSSKISSVVCDSFATLKNLCVNIEEGTSKTIDISARYKGVIGYFRRNRRRAV